LSQLQQDSSAQEKREPHWQSWQAQAQAEVPVNTVTPGSCKWRGAKAHFKAQQRSRAVPMQLKEVRPEQQA
jgi:hypothetical protein